MAGDWIKMRTALLTSPKVNGIARYIESDTEASRALSTGFNGPLNEIVTRNVTRYVAVTALLLVWGAANEHTSDGIFLNADLSDIDDIAGIPGFGSAMESVGWASFDADAMSVSLPNFNEYNTSGKVRSTSGADRQRKYRERKATQLAATRDADSDVTNDVTVTEREEKRREEEEQEQQQDAPTGASQPGPGQPKLELTNVRDHPDTRVVQGVLKAYHDTLPNCRRMEAIVPTLQRRILATHKLAKQLCKAQGWEYSVADFWGAYFGECLDDPWLRGDVPNPNNVRWKQNLTVLLEEKRFAEIMDRAIAAMRDEEHAA